MRKTLSRVVEHGSARLTFLFHYPVREHDFKFRGPIDFLRAANGEVVHLDALFERQT